MSASFRRAGCLLLAVLAGAPANAAPADFNVRAFHAAGDGMALDTPALQGALDACAAAGGGRVVLPPGTCLSGTLHLRDNVELHLDQGAINVPGAWTPAAGLTEDVRLHDRTTKTVMTPMHVSLRPGGAAADAALTIRQSGAYSRPLPVWGFDLQCVKHPAPDARPPFVAEAVGRLEQQAARFAAAP